MNGTEPEVTPKNLQNFPITSKSGRLTLPSRYAVTVLRLIPMADDTSPAVILLPSFFSLSFQSENSAIFTIVKVTYLRILHKLLTIGQMYDNIILAKTLNEVQSHTAIVTHFFGISNRANSNVQRLGRPNRVGSFAFLRNGQAARCSEHQKRLLPKERFRLSDG